MSTPAVPEAVRGSPAGIRGAGRGRPPAPLFGQLAERGPPESVQIIVSRIECGLRFPLS